MSWANSILTTVRATAFIFAVFVMAQPAPADISILPKGMEPRLLSEGGTQTSWYATREANYLLVSGSALLGSYLVSKILNSVAPQVPVGTILTAAGIALDYSFSPSWKDFTFKQAVRLPYSFYRLYYGHKYLHSWLSPLLMESPTLLTAAWEIKRQMQPVLPEDTRQVHTGTHVSTYELVFHNASPPFFSIHADSSGKNQCGSTQNRRGFWELEQVSCALLKRGLNTLRLTSHPDDNTLVICLDPERKSTSKERCHTIRYHEPVNTPWLAEMLSKPVNSNTVTSILSPFSTCALSVIEDFVLSVDMENNESDCDDMLVPAVSGAYMQLATLGGRGYLLVDHTDTQGLSLPEMWLVDAPHSPAEMLSVELGALEERRIPGPEFGAWRFLSAARSIVHHTVLSKTFAWLTDKQQIPVGDKYEGEINRFTVTKRRVGELDRVNIANEVKEIENIEGEVLVITGQSGKSHLMNTLAKTEVVKEADSASGSGYMLKAVRLENGNYLVEMQPPAKTTDDSEGVAGKFAQLQQAWMKKSRHVLVNQASGQSAFSQDSLFQWLSRTLKTVGCQDKLKIVQAPQVTESTRTIYGKGRTPLQKRLERMYGLDNVEIGNLHESGAPSWVSAIKNIAQKK